MDSLDLIFAKRRGVIKPGIEAIQSALPFLGLEKLFAKPHVLVGGTNGKGTTSGFLWSMAHLAGLRVGLYSSPHIFSMRERFLGPKGLISEEGLWEHLHTLRRQIPQDVFEGLSFFDLSTLVAFLFFAEQDVDFFILEVGLGGRLDSTNCSQPIASIITSIGMDHTEYLGADLASIAAEKAGILRHGRPCFIGDQESIPTEAQKVIFSEAEHLGCILNALNMNTRPDAETVATSGWPRFLQHNFALARQVFSFLKKELSWPSSEVVPEAIKGCAEKKVPTFWGRMQNIHGKFANIDFSCLIDVGHNLQCLKELKHNLQSMPMPDLVAFTCMKDKDWGSLLAELQDLGIPLYFFASRQERSLDPESVQLKYPMVRGFTNFSELWSSWLRDFPGKHARLLVTGSVMAMSEVYPVLAEHGAKVPEVSL